MMNSLALLLSAMLAAQQPAGETQTGSQAVEESVAGKSETRAKNDDNKMICRRTAVIGSKFKKKICATKKEWETLQARSEEATRDMQRRGKGNEPVG